MNYSVNFQNSSLMVKSKKKILSNLAFFLSIIFIIISLVFTNNMVYKIDIYGLESIPKAEIIKVLDDNGYKAGKIKSNYDLENLEIVLKENIDKVSFASGVIRGNTLLINISEKINNDDTIYYYKPLYSPFDCIIKNVSLKSGTLIVNNGDVVKKGEAIVLPYIRYKDGTELSVEASAVVEAYIEISNTIIYFENHTEKVRSGKFYVTNNYSLFDINLGSRGKQEQFKDYEVEFQTFYPFKNFILPFKQTKIYYYELVEKQVYIPFENVSQNLIEENKNLLYNSLVGEVVEDIEYTSTTNIVDGAYYLTTYLKTTIVF